MNTIAGRIKNSGKTLSRISTRSGISEARLTEIAEGADPTLTELRKLASALGISLSQFTAETNEKSRAAFLFRHTMMGNFKDAQVPAVNDLSWQIERSIELLRTPDLPEWIGLFKGEHESFVDAWKHSETFRQIFFKGDLVSPFLRLPRIVEDDLGVLLLTSNHPKVDGASAILDGMPFIFISPRFPPRMLFTLAHEVGHLIAHYHSGTEFAILDPDRTTGALRPRRDKRERYADAFASCLLMPVGGVGVALKTVRKVHKIPEGPVGDIEILFLSHIFGVSFQVAAKRCEDLELLPIGGAYSLYEKLNKEHGSPEKRAKDLNLPPRPHVVFPTVPTQLLMAAVENVRRGEMSVGRAASTLNVSIPRLLEANRELLA